MIPRRAWRAVHGRPQGSTPRSRRGVPPPLHRLAYLQAGVPRPPPLHPPAPPDGHSAARIDISARPSAAARHPRGAVTPTAAGARPTPPRTPPAAAAAATAGDRTPPSGRAAVGGVEGGAWHPPPGRSQQTVDTKKTGGTLWQVPVGVQAPPVARAVDPPPAHTCPRSAQRSPGAQKWWPRVHPRATPAAPGRRGKRGRHGSVAGCTKRQR